MSDGLSGYPVTELVPASQPVASPFLLVLASIAQSSCPSNPTDFTVSLLALPLYFWESEEVMASRAQYAAAEKEPP